MPGFEEEGSWNLSFSGAGFLGLYHVGVTHCFQERAPRLLQGARRVYGSSSGTLNALSIVSGMSVDMCCSQLLGLVKQVEQRSLGIFHPGYAPLQYIRRQLEATLPGNIHILASQRLGVSVTRWTDGQNLILTDFASRDELIQAVICSLFVPFYCGMIPPIFRGERYLDGALSSTLPFGDCPRTITVSPFSGMTDICPQNTSASMHELNVFHGSFQISTTNAFMGIICLMPPSAEIVAHSCRQGYLDALRFLERRGLTKEPVLWTLVSKELPAPADGARDAGQDPGQEERPSFNWAVPNVRVKDVPNFEKLSPEMEAALKKACERDPSPWARFRRSKPGQALTYLLLPYTLPFEYMYFSGRRLVEWLPDLPADLWWMQDELRGLALGVYSSTKDQLQGLASLLAPDRPQPKVVRLGQGTHTYTTHQTRGHRAGPAQ